MKTQNRFVLFYCDDCEKLQPAIKIFEGIHDTVIIQTSSDINDLLNKIKLLSPELLLVYLDDPAKDYMHLIKTVRKSTEASSIPVLIYREVPDEEGLRNAFKKIKK